MSIESITLKSVLDELLVFGSDSTEFALDGRVKLSLVSDSGVISAFWYGPEMKGRLGDSFAPPRDFCIDNLQPGEHKIVVEQYRLGKKIDSRFWKFNVLPVVRDKPDDLNLGIVDLGRINPDQTLDYLKPLQIKSTREWFNTNGFKAYRSKNLKHAQVYAENDISPVFCFAESGLHAQRVGDVSGWVRSAIEDLQVQLPDIPFRIEMGNEINLQQNGKGIYWDSADPDVPRKVRRYIELVQKPMYQEIKAIDPTIICIAPSFSWDHKMLEFLADDLLEYADALAFHPYCNGLSRIDLERVDRSVETAKKRGVPLIYTESQINYGKKLKNKQISEKHWSEDVVKYLIYSHQAGVSEQHYFVGIDAGTTNSPAALFRKSSGKIVPTLFYESLLEQITK